MRHRKRWLGARISSLFTRVGSALLSCRRIFGSLCNLPSKVSPTRNIDIFSRPDFSLYRCASVQVPSITLDTFTMLAARVFSAPIGRQSLRVAPRAAGAFTLQVCDGRCMPACCHTSNANRAYLCRTRDTSLRRPSGWPSSTVSRIPMYVPTDCRLSHAINCRCKSLKAWIDGHGHSCVRTRNGESKADFFDTGQVRCQPDRG